jgi:hypothetical protein
MVVVLDSIAAARPALSGAVVLHARNADRAADARRALPKAEAVVVGDVETSGTARPPHCCWIAWIVPLWLDDRIEGYALFLGASSCDPDTRSSLGVFTSLEEAEAALDAQGMVAGG